jgi:hypothetical protein
MVATGDNEHGFLEVRALLTLARRLTPEQVSLQPFQ